jgi:predicted HTH domain antitoxin
MKKITIEVPDSLAFDAKDAAMLIAARLYEKGKLTLGEAAEVAGYSKYAFAEMLGSYGVSIFNYPASDMLNESKNA